MAMSRFDVFTKDQSSVHLRIDEAWIGVSVHQRIDLQLSFVESVRRWFDHILVDHFTYSTVQAYLDDDEERKAR